MSKLFSVHGKSNITIVDNIVIIESKGPWNIEYFKGLHDELKEAIQKSLLTSYGVLLIPIGEAIGVYETMEYHVKFLRQGAAKAVAINLERCDTPHSTQSLCREAYESVQLEHEFFYSNEEAINWLKTEKL